jgi:hypothetical protein
MGRDPMQSVAPVILFAVIEVSAVEFTKYFSLDAITSTLFVFWFAPCFCIFIASVAECIKKEIKGIKNV